MSTKLNRTDSERYVKMKLLFTSTKMEKVLSVSMKKKEFWICVKSNLIEEKFANLLIFVFNKKKVQLHIQLVAKVTSLVNRNLFGDAIGRKILFGRSLIPFVNRSLFSAESIVV